MSDPDTGQFEDTAPFEDAALKAALKRVRGGHRASPALRQQVMASLARVGAEAAPQWSKSTRQGLGPSRWRLGRWGTAAAASILLLIGVSMALYYQHQRHERAEYTAANQSLFAAMVAAHENAGNLRPLEASACASPESAARHLRAQLGHSVPPVRLSAAGWDLDSAGVTMLGSTQAAQWRWKRGGQRLSVFSVPLSAVVGGDAVGQYELTWQQHPVVGVVRMDSLNCVVGDPSATLDEVRALAKAIGR